MESTYLTSPPIFALIISNLRSTGGQVDYVLTFYEFLKYNNHPPFNPPVFLANFLPRTPTIHAFLLGLSSLGVQSVKTWPPCLSVSLTLPRWSAYRQFRHAKTEITNH